MVLNKKQAGWIMIILGLITGTFGILNLNWKIIVAAFIVTIIGIIIKT